MCFEVVILFEECVSVSVSSGHTLCGALESIFSARAKKLRIKFIFRLYQNKFSTIHKDVITYY